MPATVIAERIGWDRGLTVLKERVRELRPAYRPVDPASRTVYGPGELGQCDLWFPPAEIAKWHLIRTSLHGVGDDRCHELVDDCRGRRAGVAVCEQEMPATDQGESE